MDDFQVRHTDIEPALSFTSGITEPSSTTCLAHSRVAASSCGSKGGGRNSSY